MPNNPPEPVRGPNGYVPPASGGGGAPDLVVADYTGYSTQSTIRVSKGVKLSALGGPSQSVLLTGFNFAEGDTVSLDPIPGFSGTATLGAPVFVNPAPPVAGTILVPIEGIVNADARYTLSVTSAETGLVGCVLIEIQPAV